MNTYEKWLDFSTRMANILNVTSERREKIIQTVTGFINRFEHEDIKGWDAFANYTFYGEGYGISDLSDDTTYFGQYRLDAMYEPKTTSFYNQISAITRAGLDVATGDFGGGVLGFTIGDVRTMYDGRIPEWVNNMLEISGDEDDDTSLWL